MIGGAAGTLGDRGDDGAAADGAAAGAAGAGAVRLGRRGISAAAGARSSAQGCDAATRLVPGGVAGGRRGDLRTAAACSDSLSWSLSVFTCALRWLSSSS